MLSQLAQLQIQRKLLRPVDARIMPSAALYDALQRAFARASRLITISMAAWLRGDGRRKLIEPHGIAGAYRVFFRAWKRAVRKGKRSPLPLQAVGVQINNGGGYSGAVYLDDVAW